MSEREIVWSKQVQPGLWVAVEDSLNILLVVTAVDDGQKHSSDILGNVDALKNALDLARVQVARSESGAYAGGLHEHDAYAPHSHEVRADHLGVASRR